MTEQFSAQSAPAQLSASPMQVDFSHRLSHSGSSPEADFYDSLTAMTERSLSVLEALHCGIEADYLKGNEITSLLFVVKAEIQDIQQTIAAYAVAQSAASA